MVTSFKFKSLPYAFLVGLKKGEPENGSGCQMSDVLHHARLTRIHKEPHFKRAQHPPIAGEDFIPTMLLRLCGFGESGLGATRQEKAAVNKTATGAILFTGAQASI